MSLIRLLAVGKSLAGVRDEPCRYRMSEQFLLPKFGRDASAMPTVPPAETAGPTNPTSPCAKGEERNEMTTVEMESKTGSVLPGDAPARGRWSAIIPFVRKTPPSEGELVQPELSLEGVRPVRNDLSDADLEVVPRRPAIRRPEVTASRTAGKIRGGPPDPAAGAMDAVTVREERGSVGVFLSRIRARLFGRA